MRYNWPILLLISFPAWADPVKFEETGSPPYPNAKTSMDKNSCGHVDLMPHMGVVRNQTGGSCYAYAAMELLNYKAPKKIHYSALHLGLMHEGELDEDGGNNNSLDTVKAFTGGTIQGALNPHWPVDAWLTCQRSGRKNLGGGKKG